MRLLQNNASLMYVAQLNFDKLTSDVIIHFGNFPPKSLSNYGWTNFENVNLPFNKYAPPAL